MAAISSVEKTAAPHLPQRAWWPCGRPASGMLGFKAFPSLQGLKIKPPTTKGLAGLADCYQSFLLVLSLHVCVWNLLGSWLGSKHGSCTLLAGETPQASQCKQQVLPMSEALHPLSLFLQLCVSRPCLGWNVQPCYRRVFSSLHGSSLNVQGNAKEPECKVLYIQRYKVGFFWSDVCLRVTKAHAEAWLGLLPPVPSLHTTANCNVQWEKTLQN